MSLTVYKYVLESHTELRLPVQAQPLTVHAQRNDICLWVLLDPDAPCAQGMRTFVTSGTGAPMNVGPGQTLRYIGTAHLQGGALVFHTFEVVPVCAAMNQGDLQ